MIKEAIVNQKRIISNAQKEIDSAKLNIAYFQSKCSHEDKTSWTNDDGDGSFKVEKCNICGLQKDGGFK